MVQKNKCLTVFLSLLALSCSCKGGSDSETDASRVEAPKLLDKTPGDGSEVKGATLDVRFTFDQNVRVSSANLSRIVIEPEATISKFFASDAVVTVSLADLAAGSSYTLTVPAGLVNGYKKNQEAAGEMKCSFSVAENHDVVPDDFDFLADVSLPDNSATAFTAWLGGMGWNLGNHLEATGGSGLGTETSWGNPKATESTFRKVREYGFTAVRIPVTWQSHIGPAPDYKVDEAWMDRVAEVVEYAHKAGLKVILNMHHDDSANGGWFNLMSAVGSDDYKASMLAEYASLWTQIANEFKDEGSDWLMFEAYNEPHAGANWGSDDERYHTLLNEVLQLFVDTVRGTGGENADRWLGLPAFANNPTYAINYLKLPQDSARGRLAVSFHCYDPYKFTLAPEDSDGIKKWGNKSGSKNDEKTFVELYYRIKAKFVDKDIPVYAGEVGCGNRGVAAERACQLYYIEFTWKVAREYGICPFLWDNGARGYGNERHAYINHGTGEYESFTGADGKTYTSKDPLDIMKKAIFTTDPAYTIQSVYNTAP